MYTSPNINNVKKPRRISWIRNVASMAEVSNLRAPQKLGEVRR